MGDFQMLKSLFNQNSIADKYKNLVNQINVLENTMQTLTDSELRAKTFELKKIAVNEPNNQFIIANSFAVTREASIRALGLRHFDVQLIGGLVLRRLKKGQSLPWFCK